MAIDIATFKLAFPEFRDAPDDVVATQLAYAETRAPVSIWGDRAEEGAFLWCAKFLAMSPFGRHMGLVDVKQGGETPYDQRLAELLRAVAPRHLVL